jgi:hypothetical protein
MAPRQQPQHQQQQQQQQFHWLVAGNAARNTGSGGKQ